MSVTCDLKGGLGNQLFQIFAVISYAIKYNKKFIFEDIYQLGKGATTIRYTYWNSFLSALKPFVCNISNTYMTVLLEKDFMYTEIPNILDKNVNILLNGYYQSYKYFAGYYSTIYKLLQIDNKKDELMRELSLPEDTFAQSICMHFRLGDYKKLPQYHPIQPLSYYEKAIDVIRSTSSIPPTKVYYFCEKSECDDVINNYIRPLKENDKYKTLEFIRFDFKLEDWKEMLLMSCCEHFIIANSTFSWWAAYMATSTTKTVCYPQRWFGDALPNHNIKDLCPTNWVKICI